jgi:transposase
MACRLLINKGGQTAESEVDKTILGENVLTNSEILLGLPAYQITEIRMQKGVVRFTARYTGAAACRHCNSTFLRNKGRHLRRVRHENWGQRTCILELQVSKWHCRDCGRYFRQRLPGILPRQRASEAYQQAIYQQHLDGINRSRLGRREKIGAATVERYFRKGLKRQFNEWHPPRCPQILGIDEHFFTRRKGFATTLCDLKNHKVYDVVLGRSELSLEPYLQALEGKDAVRVVCMDLSSTYRSIVRKHFPKALIVAGRFHVIRLINHHFLNGWRDIDLSGSKNRGLLSLMRRHRRNLPPEQWQKLAAYFTQFPVLEPIYQFKPGLCDLLLHKHRTQKQCRTMLPRFLRSVEDLLDAKLTQLVQLGETLRAWSQEIAAMWRFTRNHGITEGFHTKMEMITRQAFGFRNFENYRLRVKVLCG